MQNYSETLFVYNFVKRELPKRLSREAGEVANQKTVGVVVIAGLLFVLVGIGGYFIYEREMDKAAVAAHPRFREVMSEMSKISDNYPGGAVKWFQHIYSTKYPETNQDEEYEKLSREGTRLMHWYMSRWKAMGLEN